MSRKTKGILLSFLSVVIMAITPVTNKLSLHTLTPIQASFYNALLSTVFSFTLLVIRKQKVTLTFNRYLILVGVFNTVGIILQYVSASLLDPVTIGLLGRFYTVFAVLLSILVLKEKLQRRDIFPIFLTIIGSFVISAGKGSFNNFIGIIFTLSYTFFFALTNTLAKKGLSQFNSSVVLFYNQLISTVFLFFLLVGSNQLAPIELNGFGPIFISAFCSGFLGLLLFYDSLKYITFREANIIRTTNPIFVFLISLPFFSVNVSINLLVGGALIIFSIIYMNKK
ncbi:DMT family transporter [Tuanshanicoccus lijuaniae]|uniref:DMT family transporter n=1 Tax=Aerococcaceae bacterium zg-1292 TaxID=2774330 RepID=UPI0019368DAF|nr:DMT family transporter [Aerococcaceae bacterium zg-1292]MBS4456279.1 DMT family transporter [Aerococcaceae bacterium zg-A91]MBS4458134.1 DMT family transporter [Aerococcaceae bacterium zg-BR33]QQA37564.1 DMT family transporter [Aerococcaceae bacterium zg-1292]